MDVTVDPIRAGEESALAALLQLYVYDFSAMLGLELGEDGRYATPSTEGRDAFLIRVDGKLAGFALIAHVSRLTGEEGVHDVAEFFVVARHRRNRVGERAASLLFDRFPGRWEVREKSENERAIAFWRRAIGRYTNETFTEEMRADERWKGPIQRFESGKRA
ncbi:MAG TPA: GNAT family N-acetyltransferase [Polyangiaceae bacterium]